MFVKVKHLINVTQSIYAMTNSSINQVIRCCFINNFPSLMKQTFVKMPRFKKKGEGNCSVTLKDVHLFDHLP